MSEKDEKSSELAPVPTETEGTMDDLPLGWRYYKLKIGNWRAPHYASPFAQLLLVAATFFLCPGMYNALNGLGGAGQLDPTVQNNATVALFATFAVVAFFSGAICNKLGVRLSLIIGSSGYTLYMASFLCFNHTGNAPFVIASGAILGFCAGLFWSAQSIIMISYPDEESKGTFIGIFWMIFNLGATIGSLVPLIQNLHSTGESVSDGTYIGFIVLSGAGILLNFALCNADQIVRNDGSKVIMMKHPTWKSEFIGLWEVMRTTPWILALVPMFVASNWFYTYQFNDYNLARFNIRTRSLNSLCYWSAQILAALGCGRALDSQRFQRHTRARAGLIVLFAVSWAVWGGGYVWQRTYDRTSASRDKKVDFTDSNYGALLVLYICYGAFDAMWQLYIYWVLGALSNNSRKLAILVGFYKCAQSAGQTVMWRIDALKAPYMNIFAGTWGLVIGALIIGAPVVWLKVKRHTEEEEDVKFSDGTVNELHVKKEDAPPGV
ncbi:major facilitator superfamily domain-containing protein [Trichoderma sp. SZMC 28012]